MFFHSAISTNITWPNEHLSNVNTITFIQEKLSSILWLKESAFKTIMIFNYSIFVNLCHLWVTLL